MKKTAVFSAITGTALLAALFFVFQGLQLGARLARFDLYLWTVLLVALAMYLLYREGVRGKLLAAAFPVICAAMLLRGLCLDYVSSDYTFFLQKWVAYFRENGGFAALSGEIGDYNVPYLYFLAAFSYLPLPDLYLIKLLSILADVGLAWGGMRLAATLREQKPGDLLPLIVFCCVLFLPTVVLNSAKWGQCDAIYVALLLHALVFALRGKGAASTALLAVAFSFKLQTIFLLPLWGAMWLVGKLRTRALLAFPAAYLLTILPALLLGKPLGAILGVYANQMGEYSRLTMSAPSVFQFLPMGTTEESLGRVGILVALALALGLVYLACRYSDRLDKQALALMAAVLAVGIPYFLPHMHDRYFFLADVLTACLAFSIPAMRPAAVLTSAASLSAYISYLRGKELLPLTLFGKTYAMPIEALVMLAALAFCCRALYLQMRKPQEIT